LDVPEALVAPPFVTLFGPTLIVGKHISC